MCTFFCRCSNARWKPCLSLLIETLSKKFPKAKFALEYNQKMLLIQNLSSKELFEEQFTISIKTSLKRCIELGTYRNRQFLLRGSMHVYRTNRSKENVISNTEFLTGFLDLLVLMLNKACCQFTWAPLFPFHTFK